MRTSLSLIIHSWMIEQLLLLHMPTFIHHSSLHNRCSLSMLLRRLINICALMRKTVPQFCFLTKWDKAGPAPGLFVLVYFSLVLKSVLIVIVFSLHKSSLLSLQAPNLEKNVYTQNNLMFSVTFCLGLKCCKCVIFGDLEEETVTSNVIFSNCSIFLLSLPFLSLPAN